jgi:hypothetical protein
MRIMRKFTKILEDLKDKKVFKIDAQVELAIKASSEGEASYIADLSLASMKNQYKFTINSVEESPSLLEKFGEQPIESQDPEEMIRGTWKAEFGDRIPTSIEKLEFYHDMRKVGFTSELVHKVLKDKLLGS